MKEHDYKQFILELKQSILSSRYLAAKLANKELLLLYMRIGEMIDDKSKKATWGTKILSKISNDLQQDLVGLRGFSSGNLKKMRVFYRERSSYIEFNSKAIKAKQIGSTVSNLFVEQFFSLCFSHHYSIISKTKNIKERIFYGVATYKTSKEIPTKYKKVLPNIDDLRKLM